MAIFLLPFLHSLETPSSDISVPQASSFAIIAEACSLCLSIYCEVESFIVLEAVVQATGIQMVYYWGSI